jgi:hypothetical protein
MLDRDLALALDPCALMLALGMTPDPWQRDLLRSEAQRMLLNCSRQSGKTTAAAVLALHEACFRPPALVLIGSPALRQAQEVFRTVTALYGRLGEAVPTEAESALRLELVNGSRIIALPGSEATVRGYAGVRLVLLDEASRVPDVLYDALAPALAVSRGRIILLSTPFGKRGVFHHLWSEGGADWYRVRVPASECARIPASFLEEQRRTMPLWNFRQEFECEFVETSDQVFSYEDVKAALSDKVLPLFGGGA